MFPAQPPAPMPQTAPAMPPPQGAPPLPPGAAPRKSRAMVFVIGGVVAVVAIIVIAVVASGKSKKKGDVNEVWLESVEDASDKICACKDEPCVHQAVDDLEYLHKNIGTIDLNREQQARADELSKKMLGCIKKVPGTDKPHKAASADDQAFKDIIEELVDLRGKMCKCKDADCARQVRADYDAAFSEWKDKLDNVSLSKDDEKLLKQGIMELLSCEELAKKKGGD